MRKLSTADFVEKARKIHENKYDYSKSIYINAKTKITITCNDHGDFIQNPANHCGLKQGCPKCSGNYRYKNDEWITEAKNKHGDKYDYSKTQYKNNETNVIITCEKHGDFKQQPGNHLFGKGCGRCAKNRPYTTEEWIIEAKKKHGEKFDYSKVVYIKSNQYITIICKDHGQYEQTPRDHLASQIGCAKCAGNYSYKTKEWIEEARKVHGEKYDYSKVDYTTNEVYITIICKNHQFQQTPHNHLKGRGCGKCKNKTESKLFTHLNKFFKTEHNVSFDWCKNEETGCYLPFDFLLKDYNIIIELDGPHHFEIVSIKNMERDAYKMNKALENKYNVIRLLQKDVFEDLNFWDEWLHGTIQTIQNYKQEYTAHFPDREEYTTLIKFFR